MSLSVVGQTSGQKVKPKKIMVVKLGESDQSMKIAAAPAEYEPRAFTVGGFLNYEEVRDDE